MTIASIIKSIQENYKTSSAKLSVDDIVKVLKKTSDAYYNTDDTLISDEAYDYLRDLLEKKDPANDFLSEVGAPVKGTKEKVLLPCEMGSLNKIKPDTEDMKKWIKTYPGPYVLSDKLDGASAQLYKNSHGKTFLYSRGDLTHGQNISHLIKYLFDDDQLDNIPNETCIRGELIISIENFKSLPHMKNARNAVAGLVNSKSVDKSVAKVTEFIAYAILQPRMEQYEQMEMLEEWDIDTVPYKKVKKITNEMLSEFLLERKKDSEFKIDGIVCIDNSKIYEHKGGYPKHAFAFKMLLDEQIADATVVEVLWDPSKDGYLKPKIRIKPIDLDGTTITYATAHNAKFIVDNNIGPNAKIKIVRSGDVIPKIQEVTKGATEPQMPDYDYEWNDTKVDLIMTDTVGKGSEIVTMKVILHFFQKMNVKYLSEGIITKLVNEGYDSIVKILTANKKKLSNIEGLGNKMVTKIYDEIDRAFEEVDLVTFMAASHTFGRGLGERKIREIINVYPNLILEEWDEDEMIENILKVPGFSDKLAEKFSENFENFMEFYDEIAEIKDISRFEEVNDESSDEEDKIFTGSIIVFTGFRDKTLNDAIIKLGGKVSTSVSSKTTILLCPDGADQSSSKFAKAEQAGTKIMTKSAFIKKYKL